MKQLSIGTLLRKNILHLQPYASARDEFQGSASVYLDANENPNDTGLNRYPDPHQRALKQKIASVKGVSTENIFLGNGSDEAIDLLIRAFCRPGIDSVVIPEPTYGMYAICAKINDVATHAVPLTSEFDVDTAAIEAAWDANTKIIFLCSPNNPTGNLLSTAKILRILTEFPGIVVLDEAYIDFADFEGFLPRLRSFPNLVILQTLSKAWGLAGIRLGMCFAGDEISSVLARIKAPYNINTLTQTTAVEHLTHAARTADWVKEIKEQRATLAGALAEFSCILKVYPTDANFILVKTTRARMIYEKLSAKGIIVRDRSGAPGCDGCLRITVGTAAENEILLTELRAL